MIQKKINVNQIIKSTLIIPSNLTNFVIEDTFIPNFYSSFQNKLESNISRNIIPIKLENNITKKTIPIITNSNINLTMSQTIPLRKLDTYNPTIISTILSNGEIYCEKSCNISNYYGCKTYDLNENNKCADCKPGYYCLMILYINQNAIIVVGNVFHVMDLLIILYVPNVIQDIIYI